MKPIVRRRIGLVLAWIAFSFLAAWIFHPRYNVPEPAHRLDTKLPSAAPTPR
ncbi:MAG TPA: hypothetical protein VLW52_08995 [Opitutaceae bacterium]|nr:hypothetical protein [Opitutaceae bacterium]